MPACNQSYSDVEDILFDKYGFKGEIEFLCVDGPIKVPSNIKPIPKIGSKYIWFW